MKTEEIIDLIIEKDGDCLKYEICIYCPFQKTCLPTFISNSPTGTSKQERVSKALDYIAKQILIEED